MAMTEGGGSSSVGRAPPAAPYLSQAAFIVAVIHACWCPFTKVEESHALQAAHDILYIRTNLSQYDHHEFPGVVPRSFIGPLFLSILSSPVVFLIQIFECNKFWSQYIVRLSLSCCVISSWSNLRESLAKIFGHSFAHWFTVVTITQYHFMFYLSRTLPNIIVMPLVLLAINYWINGKHKEFIYTSGAAIIIFRAELGLLFGQFLLYDIYLKRLPLTRFLKIAIPAGIGLVLLTVSIDSIFWKRLTWPEAEVFWFNTILNKSSEWGTSPFLWYWYSALPRGLGPSIFLIPIGAYFDRRTLAFIVPALTFVFLFSFLPHKELRFVIYVFPLLNIAAASACNYLWERRNKTTLTRMLATGAIFCLIGNSLLSLVFLSVAGTNYPGGTAISKFHRLLKNETHVNVHIGNLAAQTGVTRFTQLNSNWTYSKIESLPPDKLQTYTHMIIEGKNKYSAPIKQFMDTHVILDFIEGFSHISINYNSMPPFRIKTKPSVFILERINWRENFFGVNLPPLKSVSEDDEPEELFHDSMEQLEETTDEMSDTEAVVTSVNEPISHIKQNIKQIIEKYKNEENDESIDERLVNLKESMKRIHGTSGGMLKKPENKKKPFIERERQKATASAKQKLKELITKHKQETISKETATKQEDDEDDSQTDTIFETMDTEYYETANDQYLSSRELQDEDITNYLKNTTIQDIVDEVLKKIESRIDDESMIDVRELENNEKRKVIEDIVKQILYEKIDAQRSAEESFVVENLETEIRDTPFNLEDDVLSYEYDETIDTNNLTATM